MCLGPLIPTSKKKENKVIYTKLLSITRNLIQILIAYKARALAQHL
jgi:hypothetical protein